MNPIRQFIQIEIAKHREAKKKQTDVPPDFQGNPETHGIDEPRGGGFSIMQNLQKSLVKEEDKELKKQKLKKEQAEKKLQASVVKSFIAGERRAREWWKDEVIDITSALSRGDYVEAADRLEGLKATFGDTYGLKLLVTQARNIIRAEKKVQDRAADLIDDVEKWEQSVIKAEKKASYGAVKEAMYWCGRGRNYRLTKGEQDQGLAVCPKCKAQMEKEKFTRSEKLYRCPGCGFKVPTGSVTTQKIEIEIESDGAVEVEVTNE